jgi:hypothetical protein
MAASERIGDGAHADASGTPELEVTHAADGLLMANIGQVCLALWRTKPTRALFETQREHLAAAVAKQPGRVLFMCLLEARVHAPEQDVRDASAKMISSHGRDLAGCACVIEGHGFRSALTRTVLAGIAFVLQTPAPFRFFDNAEAACEWVEARAGWGRLQGLAAQVELARRRLEPPSNQRGV